MLIIAHGEVRNGLFIKAKGYLERAMKLDPSNCDAVYVMASILRHQQQYEAAVKLYDEL